LSSATNVCASSLSKLPVPHLLIAVDSILVYHEEKDRSKHDERQRHFNWSRPICAVERTVLNRLGNVFRLQRRFRFQVCNRPRHFQDAIVRTRAESLLGHRPLQQSFALGRQLTKATNVAMRHLGIAEDFLAPGRKSCKLNLPRADYSFQNLRR